MLRAGTREASKAGAELSIRVQGCDNEDHRDIRVNHTGNNGKVVSERKF